MCMENILLFNAKVCGSGMFCDGQVATEIVYRVLFHQDERGDIIRIVENVKNFSKTYYNFAISDLSDSTISPFSQSILF